MQSTTLETATSTRALRVRIADPVDSDMRHEKVSNACGSTRKRKCPRVSSCATIPITKTRFSLDYWAPAAARFGAATSALVSLQARLIAAVTGKPAPKPAADRLPTILDEMVALNDPTAVLVYVVLSQAQRATNGPVEPRAPRSPPRSDAVNEPSPGA